MLKIATTPFALIGLMALLLLAGCSDDETSSDPTGGSGQILLSLVDSSGPYEEVNLEVIEIAVHQAGEDTLSGWRVLSADTLAIDLLDYVNGASLVLADTVLAAGEYTQVRLLLGQNNTVVVDGQTHDLEIPSGSTTGVKLNHPFTIQDGALPAGSYDLEITPAFAGWSDTVLTGVDVVNGQDTELGTITLEAIR